MNKERLKEILLDQKEVFSQPKQLIDRDIDLNKYIQTSGQRCFLLFRKE